MSDELVITEQNFNDYFHDVRFNQPQKGQVMARYTATAEFIDGPLKRDILEILLYHDARSSPKLMKKMACATEADSLRLPREMANDMASGMSMEEVARKEYRYIVEMFFYTKKEYVPKDDPHWTIINLLNLDNFLDADRTVVMTTKEVTNEDLSARPQPGDGEGVEAHVEADRSGR